MSFYNQPIASNNFAANMDSEKFFSDFNNKVQSDWNQMCDQSRREWQDWARRNNVQNIDFPNQMGIGNFPGPMQTMQSNFSPMPLRQDNNGCGRLIGDVRNDERGLELSLDCALFRPEEIKVTTVGNELVIEAKHDHNNTSGNNSSSEHRQFMQKYTLPQGCNPESVTSQLSHNGVLTVSAPKPAIAYSSYPRAVPIQGGSASPRVTVSQY